jgi:uncharacterized coiled-coil DUF342 family protein
MQDIYTDGFLDGQRHAGHLIEDVEDSHLNLTYEFKRQMLEYYTKRGYTNNSIKKQHTLITRLIKDADNAYEEAEELRRLLVGAQRDIKLLKLNQI